MFLAGTLPDVHAQLRVQPVSDCASYWHPWLILKPAPLTPTVWPSPPRGSRGYVVIQKYDKWGKTKSGKQKRPVRLLYRHELEQGNGWRAGLGWDARCCSSGRRAV